MLATRIAQKEGAFYFVSFPAEDLLRKVRFISRFDSGDETIAAKPVAENDEVGRFIEHIERSDVAFQRTMAKRKIAQLRNFFETAGSQPIIPGAVLLFTAEHLRFKAVAPYEHVGDLSAPDERFLIIDGQHRCAALNFHCQAHPDEARQIHVPCMIFDGRSEDFAAEMFVIINSTPTRINKSHLIELYERITFVGADRKLAAQVTQLLYAAGDSPLQYRINRLGGRSSQVKWILQAELFNEVLRWLTREGIEHASKAEAERRYGVLRDGFKAAAAAFGEAWGGPGMITKPVTLKALVRVFADLAATDDQVEGRVARWTKRFAPWAAKVRDFRADGFYERFPAKGQIERVGLLHRELSGWIDLAARRSKRAKADE